MPTPNPYIKALICAILLSFSFAFGFYTEHLRFANFKEQVSASARVQKQHNEDLKKERELENAKRDADFANQLANIKRLYSNRVFSFNPSTLPRPSATLVSVNGYTTDPVFAEQCANTTAQLISLQQWVKDQVGIQ